MFDVMMIIHRVICYKISIAFDNLSLHLRHTFTRALLYVPHLNYVGADILLQAKYRLISYVNLTIIYLVDVCNDGLLLMV